MTVILSEHVLCKASFLAFPLRPIHDSDMTGEPEKRGLAMESAGNIGFRIVRMKEDRGRRIRFLFQSLPLRGSTPVEPAVEKVTHNQVLMVVEACFKLK